VYICAYRGRGRWSSRLWKLAIGKRRALRGRRFHGVVAFSFNRVGSRRSRKNPAVHSDGPIPRREARFAFNRRTAVWTCLRSRGCRLLAFRVFNEGHTEIWSQSAVSRKACRKGCWDQFCCRSASASRTGVPPVCRRAVPLCGHFIRPWPFFQIMWHWSENTRAHDLPWKCAWDQIRSN